MPESVSFVSDLALVAKCIHPNNRKDLDISIGKQYTKDHGALLEVYKRPGYGKIGEPVKLLVNWFGLDPNFMHDNKRIYIYVVKISTSRPAPRSGRGGSRGGRGGGRGGGAAGGRKEMEPKSKNLTRAVFWSIVRAHPQIFEDYSEIIFDDRCYVFTRTLLDLGRNRERTLTAPHPERERADKDHQCHLHIKEFKEFDFDLQSNDYDTSNVSQQVLTCILSQRARYFPDQNRQREMWNHYQRFEAKTNCIYLIPRTEDIPKVAVEPGVNAWIALYITIKRKEDFNPVIEYGIVNKLFLEMDMPLITFYTQVALNMRPLSSAEEEHRALRQSTMNDSQRRKMTAALRDVRVYSDYALVKDPSRRNDRYGWFLGSRHYQFIEVTDSRPHSQKAEKNGRETIQELYAYLNKPLRYPHLPLVKVKVGVREELQPMEVLRIHHMPQPYRSRDMSMLMRRNYIRAVTRDPQTHAQYTKALIENVYDEPDPFQKAFDVKFSSDMIECTGNVIPAPRLINVTSENKEEQTLYRPLKEDRSFRMMELAETPSQKLVSAVVVLQPEGEDSIISKEDAVSFAQGLMSVCQNRGMIVQEGPTDYFTICKFVDREGEAYQRIKKIMSSLQVLFDDKQKEKKPKERDILVVIVINKIAYDLYGDIKLVCDVELGLANQVVDVTTVLKVIKDRVGSITPNISLKTNAKMGGSNQRFDMTSLDNAMAAVNLESSSSPPNLGDSDVMYVGIDVTHPSPGSSIDISIASMVASIDAYAVIYKAEVMAQMRPKETVECFDAQFQRLMMKFHDSLKKWPKHVVIYRDGVSDSEIMRTASIELGWIRKAWENIIQQETAAMPTFTYIVVQKRHKTKFYKPGADNKLVNIDSGTTIDRGVVSGSMFDFYLASHHGAIGTTRAAHYTVVFDEWRRTPDEIYEMCYRLCFLSSRCRKPISIPAPIHYAHLACDRAKHIYIAADRQGKVGAVNRRTKTVIENYITTKSCYPGMYFV